LPRDEGNRGIQQVRSQLRQALKPDNLREGDNTPGRRRGKEAREVSRILHMGKDFINNVGTVRGLDRVTSNKEQSARSVKDVGDNSAKDWPLVIRREKPQE